ncbi:MAG: hypothetical protein WCN95_10395 [bacterium]
MLMSMVLFCANSSTAQQINASTNTISAVTTQWNGIGSQNMTVSITGGSGIMLYSIFTDKPWFSATPASGESSGELDPIKIMFYPEGLDVGIYTGNITIMGTFCTNQPVVIPVTLTVDPNVAVIRGVRIVPGSTGVTGYRMSIPLQLICTGEVNAVGFSVGFNKSVFSSVQVANGADALDCSLVTNGTKVATGQIGIMLAKPPGLTFATGSSEIAVLSFLVSSATAPGMYPLSFTNSPIPMAISTADAYPLAGKWPTGTVQISAGYEADVAPRPNGTNDGTVEITDWVQVGRFAASLDTTTTTSEFQRVDCAPSDIRGDGAITVLDWVQAGRYYIGLDAVQLSGGPMTKSSNTSFFGTSVACSTEAMSLSDEPFNSTGSARQLTVQNASITRGATGSVSVILQAWGNENALGFSSHFDPAILRYIDCQAGPDAAGATLLANTRLATNGEVGIALALPAGQFFPSGNRDVVRIRFEAVSGFSSISTSIDLADSPLKRAMASPAATSLTADYFNATGVVLLAQVDNMAPIVTLTSPSPAIFFRTISSSLSLAGTACDNWSVNEVSWASDNGSTGICTGTSTWQTAVISLSTGTNLITVHASDPASNKGSTTVTVVSTPMSPAVANSDSDGDGLSNWQEILAGTNPNNAQSCLRVTASMPQSSSNPAGVRISWSSTPGLSYSVWRTPNIATPFTPIFSGLMATEWNTTYIDTTAIGSSAFFYRIKMDTP